MSLPSLARRVGLLIVVATSTSACTDEHVNSSDEWTVVVDSPGAALMAVHGTSPEDVWMVGADDGSGPLVLHFDGVSWTRHETGFRGDLWWVQALPDGTVYFSGSDAHVLRYAGGDFERLPTPGLGKHVVFGLWAAETDDLYAVGAVAGRNGFLWHYDGESFRELPLPADLPQDDFRDLPAFFKVAGTAPDDVWVVGGDGVILRGDAGAGFHRVASSSRDRLFTVHGTAEQLAVVGGSGSGLLLTGREGNWASQTPDDAPLLQGAFVTDAGDIWAVGAQGRIYRESGGNFERIDPDVDYEVQSLHAVWVDPEGGVWTVGGHVLSGSLDQGLALHRGAPIADWRAPLPDQPSARCPAELVDPVPEGSIARRWNEQLLAAVRRDLPRPTVHARNLLHTSIAMWDAWAAYDTVASGVVVRERHEGTDAARAEAISYASHRVLSHRYGSAVGGPVSKACFDAFMERLGFDANDTSSEGASPRAVGNRIGQSILDHYASDGAAESTDYEDPDGFRPDAPLLVVDLPGTNASDPLVWQQLVLAEAVTQNGISEGAGVRAPVGTHWGEVTPFAVERPAPGEPYVDPGAPPLALDDELVDAVVEVVRRTAELDIDDGAEIDISPASQGNNSLGANDGTGYAENPATGEPYAENRVLRGDFTRVLAEYWADGPASETPPGHWNTIANRTATHPDFRRQLFGTGEELDPLAWDVHMYLALNGALHDAAIVAWELKREYVSARPITLVRALAAKGQRSDPDGPAYHPDGLPLVEDLIEVITAESSAPGERHAHLARYVGEIAVRSWRGEPGDRATEVGGVDWIRALDWIPYQRRTFVTPAFPGYVSGHSTFSRAAAEVLTALTGSAYFPGGLGSSRLVPGYLFFEYGPSRAVELQWATYYDAADQAGQSRLWGGIHIRHDDFDGRRAGRIVGLRAVEVAQTHFDGSALP